MLFHSQMTKSDDDDINNLGGEIDVWLKYHYDVWFPMRKSVLLSQIQQYTAYNLATCSAISLLCPE